MNTKNTGALKRAAGLRLSEAACTPKRLILIHTGAAVLASLVSTVLCYLLDLQIGKTGGLGGMGARANLQTLRSLLSMLPGFAALYWEMGYFAAMLRIARGERAAPDSLLEGFCRFWPVTRYTLLKTFLLVSLTMTSLYAAVLIAAPLMEPVAESLMSALEAGAADVTQLDPTVQEALLRSSIPMLVVFGVLVLTAVVLAFYPLRLASYALLDEPRGSALAAMRTSVRLLRGHKLELLRLDLSFWWYYLLQGGWRWSVIWMCCWQR